MGSPKVSENVGATDEHACSVLGVRQPSLAQQVVHTLSLAPQQLGRLVDGHQLRLGGTLALGESLGHELGQHVD
jgi:hypothetical protein